MCMCSVCIYTVTVLFLWNMLCILHIQIYICTYNIYIYGITIINVKGGHEFERNQRESYGRLGGRKGNGEIMQYIIISEHKRNN